MEGVITKGGKGAQIMKSLMSRGGGGGGGGRGHESFAFRETHQQFPTSKPGAYVMKKTVDIGWTRISNGLEPEPKKKKKSNGYTLITVVVLAFIWLLIRAL